MTYPIHLTPGEPSFDRLPVLKLRCPAGLPVDDRIYAQAQLGLTDDCFFARLWAFENEPPDQSALTVLLEGPRGLLRASVGVAGAAVLTTPDGDASDALTAYHITGEDLQGEYWGATLFVPLETFCAALGLKTLERATMLRGNVLKEHPGQSAAFLVPGLAGDDPASFGALRVV